MKSVQAILWLLLIGLIIGTVWPFCARGQTTAPATQPITIKSDADLAAWLQAIADTAGSKLIKRLQLDRPDGTSRGFVASLPTKKPSTQPATAPTIPVIPPGALLVGPTRAIKNLSNLRKGDRLYVEPGDYPISFRDVQNLTIVGLDPKHKPRLILPDCWTGARPIGPDCGSPTNEGTLRVIGSCTLENVKTVGGEDAILFGSQPGSKIFARGIEMDGGGIWRGSGFDTVDLEWSSTGRPRAYAAANFTNTGKTCILRSLDPKVKLQQGRGHDSKGNEQAETIIRVMNVEDCTLIGFVTDPWFYDGEHIWKQDLQFRPSSKLFRVIDCNFYLADIGDMTWRIPPKIVKKVVFQNCTMARVPHYTGGAKTVVFENTIVAGQKWNKTVER